ncbi:aspartate/glutamate racemase family protein [Bosea sp. OK403]|uniref:aspartate/glutamate racemase family protein n=1 Tax=Bosea sp. OK403 TaxID=1855286 RepID=UPI001FCD68AB|nr:aspartate/glutamate racemase family protein [Bosea sp. OK403]
MKDNVMRITCLHTAESNVAVFDAAAQSLGIAKGVLRHEVRAELLAAAEAAGGLTPEIVDTTGAVLLELCHGTDAVILTCSTLGPAVAAVEEAAAVPVLRVDSALAERAASVGGKVIALCAVETTMGPTTALFAEAARRSGASAEVRLVAGAWALFKAGDNDGYLTTIANAADAAYEDGASIVALAQASMAGAVGLVKKGPKPMSSPTAGLAAAMESARRGI